MEKKQLQAMLREMGVSYPPDATPEMLAEILKQESHKQWLKSSTARGLKIKRRRAKPERTAVQAPRPQPPPHPQPHAPRVASPFKKPIQRVDRKPGPRAAEGVPTPPGVDKGATAGAAGICDLCEESGSELVPHPMSEKPGSRHVSILCPDCLAKVRTSKVSDKDLKTLRRKARNRANSDPQVSYGKVKHSWGYKP
jgi:hypothetical protein